MARVVSMRTGLSADVVPVPAHEARVEDNVWLYLAISDWVEKTRRQGRRQADSDLEEMNMHGRRLVCIIGPLAVTLCAVMVDERTLAGQSTAAPARETDTTGG